MLPEFERQEKTRNGRSTGVFCDHGRKCRALGVWCDEIEEMESDRVLTVGRWKGALPYPDKVKLVEIIL